MSKDGQLLPQSLTKHRADAASAGGASQVVALAITGQAVDDLRGHDTKAASTPAFSEHELFAAPSGSVRGVGYLSMPGAKARKSIAHVTYLVDAPADIRVKVPTGKTTVDELEQYARALLMFAAHVRANAADPANP